MKLALPALVLLLLVCSAPSASAQCGPACGVGPLAWLTPQGHRGADFTAACRAHDQCYSAGIFSRRDCDHAMLENLNRACRYSDNPRACMHRARFMHLNVRIWGGLFYGR